MGVTVSIHESYLVGDAAAKQDQASQKGTQNIYIEYEVNYSHYPP